MMKLLKKSLKFFKESMALFGYLKIDEGMFEG